MIRPTFARYIQAAVRFAALAASVAVAATVRFAASDPHLAWEARVLGPDSGYRDVGWSASRVRLRFSGTGVFARIESDRTWWNSTVDQGAVVALRPSPTDTIRLAGDLEDGIHELALAKRTEPFVGSARIHEFWIEGSNPQLLAPSGEAALGIEFVGNSITCGYGVHASDPIEGFQDSTEDAEATAGARAARALGAQYRVVCYSGYGVFRDLRSEPNTLPGIYDRADPNQPGEWDPSKWHPDIVAVNLGTNDYAQGIPDSAAFSKAYADFLAHLVAVHPGVAIALVHGPMIVDGFPPDSLGRTHPNATSLLNRIARLATSMRSRLGVPVDTIVLSPQNLAVGWGGDYHPNLEQSRINGLELEAGLRRAFPEVVARAASGSRRVAFADPSFAWSGAGPWDLTISDMSGRVVARAHGREQGSLRSVGIPRGLHVLRLHQDGEVRTKWIFLP